MELKDISRVGLGGCELPEDQEKANSLISYAIDNGVNFFDEGWRYGGEVHKSEKILGIYLKNNPSVRENILVCDKLPIYEDIFNRFGYNGNNIEEVFDKILNEQLEVLNTDYLDIYMIHAIDDAPFMTEDKYFSAIAWMLKKKEEGKIKNIGFSAHIDLYKLNYYIDLFEEKFGKCIDVVMLAYNIFSGSDWVTEQANIHVLENPGAKGIELCKKHGIKVISMMPLESGRALEISHDKTFIDWCYSFIFDNKNIISTIAGTSSVKHLEQIFETCKKNFILLKKKEEIKNKISKKILKRKGEK